MKLYISIFFALLLSSNIAFSNSVFGESISGTHFYGTEYEIKCPECSRSKVLILFNYLDEEHVMGSAVSYLKCPKCKSRFTAIKTEGKYTVGDKYEDISELVDVIENTEYDIMIEGLLATDGSVRESVSLTTFYGKVSNVECPECKVPNKLIIFAYNDESFKTNSIVPYFKCLRCGSRFVAELAADGYLLGDEYSDISELYLAVKEMEEAAKAIYIAERPLSLKDKYGWSDKTIERIIEGSMMIGDTKTMLLEAWGKPLDINTTVTRYGTHEQWVYPEGNYVYIEDGIVTSFQY